jgi:hypothetical protein
VKRRVTDGTVTASPENIIAFEKSILTKRTAVRSVQEINSYLLSQ